MEHQKARQPQLPNASGPSNIISLTDLDTPRNLAEARPDLFSEAQIQWLLRNRDQNGLSESGSVLKVGKRIYLIRSRFLAWMLAQES